MRRSRTRSAGKPFGWPKSARIRRSAEVRKLYRAAGTAWRGGLRVQAARADSAGASRIAISTVRGFGSAVSRNRARRIAREAARVLRPQLAVGYDVLITVRPQLLGVAATAVAADMKKALGRGGLLQSSV